MDESRKQFSEVYDQMKHDRFGSNEDWAWKFWQASRASIEIDLDKEITNVTNKYYEEGRDDVIEAIRAAGIKVKE
ncbi:TPA: hypothetical protein RCG95_000073 [Enterobacter roggenkampii]|nr:hypothetical protein [Enterobacter roggenkampii]